MDIPLSSDALDVVHHPRDDVHLLATGLISGKIQLIDFSKAVEQSAASSSRGVDADDAQLAKKAAKTSKHYSKKWTVRPSSKSCRGVAFDHNGDSLWSLAKDGSVIHIDTETGSIVSHWKEAHEAAPSRLLPIEKNLLATGDDDGVIKLWDPRRHNKTSEGTAAPVMAYEHHFDWITSMLWCPHLIAPRQAKLSKEEMEKKKRNEEKKRKKKERKNAMKGRRQADSDEEEAAQQASNTQRERLVCTSGDGTLSVIDIRAAAKKKDAVDVSEDQEDELLSLAPVKRNSKLVVGTQLGILSLWAPSRGLLDHVDRIPGHPASVDTMCTLDDDTILTGSSDGLVRVVQIMPHALLGIVADHGGMPVERISRQGNWLASIGHGPEIKLTDLAPMLEGGDDDEDDDDDGKDTVSVAVHGDAAEEEADSEDDGEEADATSGAGDKNESDDDSSDSDAEERARPTKQPRKKAKADLSTAAATAGSVAASRSDFFADL